MSPVSVGDPVPYVYLCEAGPGDEGNEVSPSFSPEADCPATSAF